MVYVILYLYYSPTQNSVMLAEFTCYERKVTQKLYVHILWNYLSSWGEMLLFIYAL